MSVSPIQGITALDNFLGAAASADGIRGQVPQPLIGDQAKFLRGDGVWATPGGGSSTTSASATSSFVIIGTDAALSAARSLTASTGITITDGGAANPVSVSLTSQIVAAGPVGSTSVIPVITFNGQGQLTTVTSAAITPAAIGAASATSPFITAASDPNLSQFRKLIGTANRITASDSGALGNMTIDLASIVVSNTVGSTTRIPVVAFDVYGRITSATDAAITSTGGGSGTTVNTVQSNVDFGFATDQEGDIATVTISATWVMATSNIICMPYAVATADHDPEDYAIEGITAYAANFSSGVGFDIIAAAPNNTWGRYTINAHGI